MHNPITDGIFNKLNKDWLIELLVYNRGQLSPSTAANDLVYQEFVNLDSLDNSILKYFIDKKELLKELDKNNGYYFDDAVVRVHIENNLKNKPQLVDEFLKNEYGVIIKTYEDYINYRHILRHSLDNNRFQIFVKVYIARKFDFDEMLKMFTEKLIIVLNEYNKNWVGSELYQSFRSRVDYLFDSNFWNYYFNVIDDRMYKLKSKKNEEELYIENVIDNTIKNNFMEIGL